MVWEQNGSRGPVGFAPEETFGDAGGSGPSDTKHGGGRNGIRAVVGQDLTFAIRGVAIRH